MAAPGIARDDRGRPILDPLLRDLCRAICTASGEDLDHVDPDRVVFVAGAARRSARASIRPLTLGGPPPRFRNGDWAKPQVWLRDRIALYEICLRPRYFLDATPDDRARILAHELWHISPRFDGTLAEDRRHRSTDEPDSPQIDRWVQAWLRLGGPGRLAVEYTGELRVSAWTRRPPSRLGPTGRRRYDESDLHWAIVAQGGDESRSLPAP